MLETHQIVVHFLATGIQSAASVSVRNVNCHLQLTFLHLFVNEALHLVYHSCNGICEWSHFSLLKIWLASGLVLMWSPWDFRYITRSLK
jgi:hypothetical protein